MIPHDLYERGTACFAVLAGLTGTHRRTVVDTGSSVRIDRGTTLFDIGDACSGLGLVIHKTHQDLADEVGSTREMVSRILESFADQGLLTLGRKRIEIQDPEKIHHLAHSR